MVAVGPVTGSPNVVIPAGDTVLQVVVENTAGNGILGGLNIGTTNGGADVLPPLGPSSATVAVQAGVSGGGEGWSKGRAPIMTAREKPPRNLMGRKDRPSPKGSPMPLLSQTFQVDFRKYLSGWEAPKVQDIDDMFSVAGFEKGPEPDPDGRMGVRQKTARQYLDGVNWDDEDDIQKMLSALTSALFGEWLSSEQRGRLRAIIVKEQLVIGDGTLSLPPGRTKAAPSQKRRPPVSGLNIFISWSQPNSQRAAEAFREWLPKSLPGCNAWMSNEDITKGRQWFPSISGQMSQSKVCLICVTPDNVRSPWLFYEAGGIAHAMPDAMICAYLIGVESSALYGTPLAEFQHTKFDKEDTRRLIRDFNRELGTPHDETLLRSAFDKNWLSLQRKLNRVLQTITSPGEPDEPDDPDLSPEAEHVLKEAAKDPRGAVTMTKNMHGFDLTAHDMQLVDGNDPRVEAAYRGAVKDLVSAGLLEPRGTAGESFGLTSAGWTLADSLKGD